MKRLAECQNVRPTDRCIIWIIQVVDQRSHNSHVHSRTHELSRIVWIIYADVSLTIDSNAVDISRTNASDYESSDPVNCHVHRTACMGIRRNRIVRLPGWIASIVVGDFFFTE